MSAEALRRASVRAWAAWAPGLEERGAWEAWCEKPEPLAAEGHPKAAFLPAMLRRRCSPLTRIILTAAFECVGEEALPNVRTVFASRHGSVNESIDMLGQIAQGSRLSPMRFSHTVHNAQAGLFCIAAQNREASSSLAGREDTFGCGYLEALGHLEREPERPVLLVMGDVQLAPDFATLVDEPPRSYAVAFLLARSADGTELQFDVAGGDPAPEFGWPHAAEFLRFLRSTDDALSVGRFHWRRI
ncbi:MAG: beta-ketoacyl synthase chain length factor [Myxococcota bacterium]